MPDPINSSNQSSNVEPLTQNEMSAFLEGLAFYIDVSTELSEEERMKRSQEIVESALEAQNKGEEKE